MRPNRSTVALTAASASAGFVMSNFRTSSSANFPRALATLSVLRPVATTLWPPANAALAISTPKPRPAPVMSQTLLVAMVRSSCIGRLSVFLSQSALILQLFGVPRTLHEHVGCVRHQAFGAVFRIVWLAITG